MTPNGEYMPIGHAHYDDSRNRIMGDVPRFLGLVFHALRDPERRKAFKMLTKAETIDYFRDLMARGLFTPIIGRTFALNEVAAAMQSMQAGEPGRIIITP